MTDTTHIDYSMVEIAINHIISQNQKPTTNKIKERLKIEGDTFDQIIEYYTYMWEQRHTATHLATLEPAQHTESQIEDFAKRTIQLEESLAMMRATIEATEDCLLMMNEQGKIFGYNKKFLALFNIPESVLSSRDETDGLNYILGQLVDPKELFDLLTKKYQNPTPGSCGEMFFKDGKVVERYYQPQIVNEKVVGHVWSLRDITDKRKQEETLHLTNRAITASTHGIILIENSAHYPITYLNPASLALLHLDEFKSMQKAFLDVIPGFLKYRNQFLEILKSKIKGSITLEYQNNNKVLWLEITIDPVFERGGSTISHFVSIINNITKSKELESILQYKAVHDSLTGLPNKSYIEDMIRYRIRNAIKNKENFGLLFIDIDRFKNVNDTLGHRVGDKLLCLFSKRLQSSLQKQDIIARVGGDEFIILINNTLSADTLNTITKRLLETCRKKFTYNDHEFNITASIGIVQYPDCGTDPETLIRNADIAMYQAKQAGRNRTCFYTKTLNHTISRRVEIENALHNAIKNNDFELHFQPIYSIAEKKFCKAETLIRWKNKQLGQVSPAEFIPIAEDIGMMTVIGRWVIESSIAQLGLWEKNGLGDLVITLNVSAKQLVDENFVHHISQTIEKNKVSSKKLIIEITESFLLLEEKAINKLNELNKLGVKIAIDDFGTGYSNLNYLNKLHITYLKIDKTFIDQIDQSEFNDSVLLAIIAIAKRMKYIIVAEGVETETQYTFLEKSGCNEIQGYYLSKPLCEKDFLLFMKNKK